jgi:hypothetical protein
LIVILRRTLHQQSGVAGLSLLFFLEPQMNADETQMQKLVKRNPFLHPR